MNGPRAVAQPPGLVPKHKQQAGPPGFGCPPVPTTHALGLGTGMRGDLQRAWYRSTSNGLRAGPAHSQPRPAPANSQDLRRQMPTSAHARFRAGKGKERRWTAHSQPSHVSLTNPQPHRFHCRLSQGPSLWYRLEIATAPAGSPDPWASPRQGACPQPVKVLCSQELRRPPAHTHALGTGMGKSGGGPSMLATPPRSLPATLPARWTELTSASCCELCPTGMRPRPAWGSRAAVA